MWDLNLPIRDRTHASAVKALNLKHWTTSKVPLSFYTSGKMKIYIHTHTHIENIENEKRL